MLLILYHKAIGIPIVNKEKVRIRTYGLIAFLELFLD